jgi:hypothetical protein
MVGQAALGFFVLFVLVLGAPVSLDVKKFDGPRGAVEDVINGAVCDDVL